MLSVHLDVRDIVLEDGGDIDLNSSTGQKSRPTLPMLRPGKFSSAGRGEVAAVVATSSS